MNGDISIDVGDAVPYLVECVKSWFGKDKITIESKARFEKLFRLSVRFASHVQCIGMWKPIPISDIYQPIMLTQSFSEWQGPRKNYIDIFDFINEKKNAIIFAGPGDGKTTLLHWTFIQLLKMPKYVPLLITLRWPDAVKEFEAIIGDLREGKSQKRKNQSFILLVDGYDEVNTENRKKVSQMLSEFSAFNIGNFFLTCRSNYEIYDIKEPYYWITKFNYKNSLAFCKMFLSKYSVETDPDKLLRELNRRGFQSFTEHPLMLALVCLLQSIPTRKFPRSTIGLIRLAVDTLTFRWDESKGLSRLSTIPLDGEDRNRCLMKIAYEMKEIICPDQIVFEAAREYLLHEQIEGIDIRKFLIELAQWYGLLIPVSPEEWGFVHRTIHDFLAARYWVECGGFASDINYISKWDNRAAYAMSLLPNATRFLKKALNQNCGMHVFTQCLINNAKFDPDIIAESIFDYFRRKSPSGIEQKFFYNYMKVSIDPGLYFFRDASIPFLKAILNYAIKAKWLERRISGIFLAFALFELVDRNLKIEKSIFEKIIQYLDYPDAHYAIKISKDDEDSEAITIYLDSVPLEN